MSAMTLSFRVSNPDVSIARGVVGRIYGYTEGGSDELPSITEVIIPTSIDNGLTITVDPGRYRVQAMLPTGAILQRETSVGEGKTVSIAFSDDDVRGLTAGSVEVVPNPRVVLERHSIELQRYSQRTPRLLERLIRLVRGDRGGYGKELRRVRVEQFPDTWRGAASTLPMFAQRSIGGELIWQAFSDASRVEELISLLTPYEENLVESTHISQGFGVDKWQLNVAPYVDLPRLWALSRGSDLFEIASLPLPWRSEETNSTIEVVVSGSDNGMSANTLVSVRDPILGGLLAYLNRGQLANIRPLIESLERDDLIGQTIENKQTNPLAACAAAYVGLAIFEPYEAEKWDLWLPNIMNWFPSIPDGAIVHARRVILRPRSPAETENAVHALKEAYRRGIPYFTAGVLLLRDSLLLLKDKDKELGDMLENVSKVTSRLDVGQAFTVLRYSEEDNV